MTLFEKYALDKTKFSFGSREELEQEDIEFWKNTTVEERLEALELLRQINCGDCSPTDSIQRVSRFIETKKRLKSDGRPQILFLH